MAAQLLAGSEHLDPSGRTARRDLGALAASGDCFAATADKSQAVYIVRVDNGVAWIAAAKGAGDTDWTATLLPIIEAQAKGCASVAFQTRRRGLVRRAEKQGYKVAGWILKKELQS